MVLTLRNRERWGSLSYYGPDKTQRWASPQTLNLYDYVGGDPTNHADADGHIQPAPGGDRDEDLSEQERDKKGEAAAASAAQNKPLISASVEGGYGLEGKAHIGPVELKAGGAVKGEFEVSPDGTKVSAKAEADVHVGSLKPLGGVQAEVVTKNEAGQAEAPTFTRTPAGFGHGNTEATASKDEFTIGVSAYPGWGGGFSVTIRPQAIIESVTNSLINVVEGAQHAMSPFD